MNRHLSIALSDAMQRSAVASAAVSQHELGKNEGRHALVIAARALAPNIRTKKMSRRWIFLAGGIFDLCDWSNSWLLVASVWLMGASTDAQRRAGTYKDGSQTTCPGR